MQYHWNRSLALSHLLFALMTLYGFSQADETRTGCLREADQAGFYLLELDSGQVLTLTGDSGLERFAADVSRVRVVGSMEQGGNREVLRVTDVEYLSASCTLPLEFSQDALEEAIGRARVGVRGGVGFDPELIYLGAHAQVGPIVKSLWFRPNFEVGVGEVTNFYSLNLEFAYFLPLLARGESPQPNDFWSVYLGAGPGFMLIDRDFEGELDEPVEVEDTDTDVGLNFLVGLSHTTGFFGELRAGAYESPDVRIMIGYTF